MSDAGAIVPRGEKEEKRKKKRWTSFLEVFSSFSPRKKARNGDPLCMGGEVHPLVTESDLLHLTLQFLTPRDVAQCSRVCRSWHQEINDNDHNWKKPASNVSPLVFEALEAVLAPTGCQQKITFKNIAKGLHQHKEYVAPPTVARKAKISAEDLFISMELKYNNETIWAACRNLDTSNDDPTDTPDNVSMLYDVPSECLLLHQLPPKGLSGSTVGAYLEVNSILWRRDTGKSFSLNKNGNFDGEDFQENDDGDDFEVWFAYPEVLFPRADTLEGQVARELCFQSSIDGVRPAAELVVEPLMHNSASYEIVQIHFDFHFFMDNENRTFDDFLIFLDGLAWV